MKLRQMARPTDWVTVIGCVVLLAVAIRAFSVGAAPAGWLLGGLALLNLVLRVIVVTRRVRALRRET